LKRPAAFKLETSPSASARLSGPVRFAFARSFASSVFAPQKFGFRNGTFAPRRTYPCESESKAMLVERGLQVMNVAVVGDAYAIAANYLRRTGAIAETTHTDERLVEIIVQMFHRGEFNKIRLANKAIAKFEAEYGRYELV
jgi:hypothetical protein